MDFFVIKAGESLSLLLEFAGIRSLLVMQDERNTRGIDRSQSSSAASLSCFEDSRWLNLMDVSINYHRATIVHTNPDTHTKIGFINQTMVQS